MNRAARRDVLRQALRAVAAGAALAFATVAGAVPPGPPGGGATATRGVVEYQALEGRLAQLAVRRDRAALEALIDDDFAAFAPGAAEPQDRAAFVADALAHSERSTVYALDVLERGEVDVVSFLIRPQTPHGGSATGTAYIVDLWRRADHHLLARYRSLAKGAPPPPSAPTGRN